MTRALWGREQDLDCNRDPGCNRDPDCARDLDYNTD